MASHEGFRSCCAKEEIKVEWRSKIGSTESGIDLVRRFSAFASLQRGDEVTSTRQMQRTRERRKREEEEEDEEKENSI